MPSRVADKSDETLQAKYTYLADGTKVGVEDASGNGYAYIGISYLLIDSAPPDGDKRDFVDEFSRAMLDFGSLVYRKQGDVYTLESTPFSGGRIIATETLDGTDYQPYYFVTDYLGSVRAVVNNTGDVIETNDYYPLGSRWDDANSLISDNRYRFNGKELQTTGDVGYLDYGSRMYDTELGRWFNTDPAAQFANPYLFCGNNPVNYVDPNGEYVVVDAWIVGFFKGLFSKGEGSALERGWDRANRDAGNDCKIWGGLGQGTGKQILSRIFWELPQTLGGLVFSLTSNMFGDVQSVDYYDGATVVSNPGWDKDGYTGWGGITIGSYINGGSNLKADPSNALFQHEYGHYLQSQSSGWAYLHRYALPSLFSSIENDYNHHNAFCVEQDANVRALRYWYNKDSKYSGWQFDSNPITGYNTSKLFESSINQEVLNNRMMRKTQWYDMLVPIGIGLTAVFTP